MKLAFVIPAWKSLYFRETLDSFVRQTDRRFRIYVGDDASPENLKEIVDEYRESLDIVYRRFPENLGGRDLTAHWLRCLGMVEDEEYVSIFSDDDVLSDNAVHMFHEAESLNPGHNVYHWNLSFIDAQGKNCAEPGRYPEKMDVREFYRRLYGDHSIDARMPDFIFRTSALKEKGFVKFDLAYRTDNATVMSLARNDGIFSAGGDVGLFWRDSGVNLSSTAARDIVCRRVFASIGFFNWVDRFFSPDGNPLDQKRNMKMIIRELLQLYPYVPESDIRKLMKSVDFFNTNLACMLKSRRIFRRMLARLKRHGKV